MIRSYIRGNSVNRTLACSFFGFTLAICAVLMPSIAGAVDLDLGFKNTAADQPKINAAISLDGVTPLVSHQGFNPNDPLGGADTITFQPYLDTGTSGILLSKETADAFGIQVLTISGNAVKYTDVAVGGSVDYHVSQALHIHLAPFNENVDPENISQYNQTSGALNAQVNIDENPFGAVDIVGMPSMEGKVVVIDSGDLNAAFALAQHGDSSQLFSDVGLRSYVYNPGTPFVGGTTNPGIPNTTFHVKLSSVDFGRFTTVTPNGAQGPKLTNNPLIGPNPLAANPASDPTPKLKITYNGKAADGSFLLDTGAQFSMISTAMAQQLNITKTGTGLEYTDPSDPTHPQAVPDQFSFPIAGADGNPINAYGFYLDSLLLRTEENTTGLDSDPNNLNFLHVPVLVNDITSHDPTANLDFTLDGVFGMNLLTATYDGNSLLDLLLGNVDPADVTAPGAFSFITFDQVNGTLGLSLAASVPEPSTIVLAMFGVCGRGNRRSAEED